MRPTEAALKIRHRWTSAPKNASPNDAPNGFWINLSLCSPEEGRPQSAQRKSQTVMFASLGDGEFETSWQSLT